MEPTERSDRKQELKVLVEQRRGVLLARLREAIRDGPLAASVTRETVLDAADASQSELQTDIFLSVLQLAAASVSDGEDALRRLDEGRYGVCERCGQDISERRLRAMPFARRCTPCEEESDRARQLRARDMRSYEDRFATQ